MQLLHLFQISWYLFDLLLHFLLYLIAYLPLFIKVPVTTTACDAAALPYVRILYLPADRLSRSCFLPFVLPAKDGYFCTVL
jgi:hypothetical protein